MSKTDRNNLLILDIRAGIVPAFFTPGEIKIKRQLGYMADIELNTEQALTLSSGAADD
ncbi:MAG TPA: hypothetical protein PKC39_10035 [Ferruginibacter sp.]|nr:hypothetical protein [Ferruginibacter sp.]HMP21288.1 hypothetical protein [Ferruginibacter sp.]